MHATARLQLGDVRLQEVRVLAGKRAGMTVLAVATTHPAAALSHADLVLSAMDEVTRCLRGTAGWR